MHFLSLEERTKAQSQVEAFIEIFCARYGVEDKEIPELVSNLRWLGKHKSNIEGLTMKAAMTVVALAVSGILLAIWEGVKQLLHK